MNAGVTGRNSTFSNLILLINYNFKVNEMPVTPCYSPLWDALAGAKTARGCLPNKPRRPAGVGDRMRYK